MFRLLGLLGGLSVAMDLGTGAPLEESLRRSVVAVRLARLAGLSDAEVSDALYVSLLQHLGCTAYAHELGVLWGDDIAVTRLALRTDFTRPTDVWSTWVAGLARTQRTTRARAAARTVRLSRRMADGPRATCEVAREAAAAIGLAHSVQEALFHVAARWDGQGYPPTKGNMIPLSTRIMQVSFCAVLFAMEGEPRTAVEQVRSRAGGELDPDLCDLLVTNARGLLADVEDLEAYQQLLADEPDPVALVEGDRLLDVARAVGNLADLKSPWLLGHSTAVADLAAGAADRCGLHHAVAELRLAGHLHDIGMVGVSSRIWDKGAGLTVSERDQARLHPYHGERIVARVPELADVAALVGRHHERSDGSGYHRGLTAAQLPMPARLLAAADRYRVLVEGRPHRPALAPVKAAAWLREEASAGRMDPDAVTAVLAETGHAATRVRARPAGLTGRQIEVLQLVAAGVSNPGIAERLGISRRTAEHHVQDVYLKIGTSTRAGAALFAMDHGLLDRSG
ncbi:HD domain-containing phosphohydrolase [Pseudactinotalea sp. Z1748]|uniref:HD domain-containing phosphohydrolase n=1 Tax=Pseudactinotalea sp. Z1748 TaxID=3413027 RepID=UPI003C799980